MEVTEISKNVQEKRLKWYGHVVRKEDKHIIHRALDMKVEGVRASGRPKRRWSDCVTKDMKEKNLEGTDARDRRKWRTTIMNVSPT